jgi:hypothetical protein
MATFFRLPGFGRQSTLNELRAGPCRFLHAGSRRPMNILPVRHSAELVVRIEPMPFQS